MQVQRDSMEVRSRVKADRQASFPNSKICKAEGEHRTLSDALEAAEARSLDNTTVSRGSSISDERSKSYCTLKTGSDKFVVRGGSPVTMPVE